MFYVIDDFVYDFSCGGGWIYVVVVVKEMFGEVEVFVWDFKFNLVCFILVLDVFIFVGELFFGQIEVVVLIFVLGEMLECDVELVKVMGMVEV